MLTLQELKERTKLGSEQAKIKAEQKAQQEKEEAAKRLEAWKLAEENKMKDVIQKAEAKMLEAADEGKNCIEVYEVIFNLATFDYIGYTCQGTYDTLETVGKAVFDHFQRLGFTVSIRSNIVHNMTQGGNGLIACSISSVNGYYIVVSW
jgi:hypothetical protein